jgi:hypothetical protein
MGMGAGMGAGMGGAGMAGGAGAGLAGGAACLGGGSAASAAASSVAGTAMVTAVGTAGSAAVLGSVVVGPALAVGGMVMASKGSDASGDAQANFTMASTVSEKLLTEKVAVECIQLRAELTCSVLSRIDDRFQDFFSRMQHIVMKSTDYSSYIENDRKSIMITGIMAKTLKNVMEAPVIDENGAVTSVSQQALDEAEIIMAELKEHYAQQQ